MQTIKHNHTTHKRYWISEYSKIKITIPPLVEQRKIVEQINTLLKKIKELKQLQQLQLEDFKKIEEVYLKEAFNGEVS